MQKILSAFDLEGRVLCCEPYGEGHINSTYHVTTDAPHDYILQRINTTVFPDAELLMRNVDLVTGHLRRKGLDNRHVLTLVPARNGALFCRDDQGDCYRLVEFVQGGLCLQAPRDATDFEQSGAAFGQFQMQLSDFDASLLGETIPHFHDTPRRFQTLHAAIERDALGRAAGVQREIDFALAREARAAGLVDALAKGEIPLRVTHNDTKLNNVILDAATMEPLCVIDLDTVMPGAAAYDFGDSIRFGANTAVEDECDLSLVSLSLPLFEAYARGFLGACGAHLTEAEKQSLPLGSWMMTMECGARFLTDYLDGDVYFSIHRPEHNLDRCRTQFALAADMERKQAEMDAIIRRYS